MVHVGHSFVRKLKVVMLQDVPNITTGTNGGPGFVDVRHSSIAAILAQKLHINGKYHAIYTHCRAIYFISDLISQVDRIKQLSPDSLLVNCGSNELANIKELADREDIEEQVRQHALKLRSFASNFPPSVPVTCMGVVPRLSGLKMTPEKFLEHMRSFNNFLLGFEKAALRGEEPTNFRFYHMKGWEVRDNNGISEDLPVSTWCDDGGIHPRPQLVRDKLARSVKDALLTKKNMPAMR